MKYYEVTFTVSGPDDQLQDARDILMALAGEAGFETFQDAADGSLTGYVQQKMFDAPLLDRLLSAFPMPAVTVSYDVCVAEDRDWNEQWEQEGFDPIVVGRRLVVHDGRHTAGKDLEDYDLQIEIDARLAFGTGTHETTRLMLSWLLDMDLHQRRVLDCGTGTGILSIAALKAGAGEAVGYDIDEWSCDNARHNAVINCVDSRFTPLLGDASLLVSGVEGSFDVVMANINRNILLADMPAMVSRLSPGGTLLLSGFYAADVPLLADKALSLGLEVSDRRSSSDWCSLCLRRK